ncbi:MAG: response regulator [Isosphaeraceae bacterium]
MPKRQPAMTHPSAAFPSANTRPEKGCGVQPVLLLVDDDALGLRALASMFQDGQYHIETASSGREALDLIQKLKPDLVLLDVMMPVMDGFEVCRRIRDMEGVAEIPILLVTALDDRQSRLEGLGAGADDFISKPFDRAEVRARVRTITRLNRFGRLQEEILQSRQAVQELREHSARQETLRRMDRLILEARSPIQIAASVLPVLHELIQHDFSACYRRDPRGQGGILLAQFGADDPFPDRLARLAIGDLGVDDRSGSGGFLPAILPLRKRAGMPRLLDSFHSAGGRKVLTIPLGLQEKLFGVLVLGARSRLGFEPPSLETAQEVGGILSLALAHSELLESVTRGRSQLEFLSRRLLQVREEESRHIARELHDEIGQFLAVLNFSLRGIQQTADLDSIREPLEYCLDVVGRLLTKVRGLSLDLHPSLLEDFGLVTALRRHIGSVVSRTGLAVSLEADESIDRFERELETVCYRVAQEALTNAIRHGKASKVRIRLCTKACRLELTVADDGEGFDPEAALERATGGESLGLVGMRERVSLVGGEMAIISSPGKGAQVKASFPLQHQPPLPARATS